MSAVDRKFLHDISNRLAVAHGNVHILLRKMKKNNNNVSIELVEEKLNVVFGALDTAKTMLTEKRATLIEEEANEKQPQQCRNRPERDLHADRLSVDVHALPIR